MNDDAWTEALRAHWGAEPEPADAGFTERLMSSLPAQPRAPATRARSAVPARSAGVLAMVSITTALAQIPAEGLGGLEQFVSLTVALGLLTWWSLPQSRGSWWR